MKVLLMCICLTVVTANEERCDGEGYFYSKDLDKCYKTHTQEANWFGAVKRCTDEGASLLVLETNKEANYIKSLGMLNERGYGFVGVHDMFHEGVFVTIHGDLLDTLEFRTFSDGQPSQEYHGEKENQVEIYLDFAFNDIPSTLNEMFYCEKAAKKLESNDKPCSLTVQVPSNCSTSPIVIMP